MSLLTEKQIVDLIKMANVPIYLYDKICKWNEKQTTQQVNLDWSKSPIDAVKASISITWTTIEGYTETYSLGAYTKPAIAHPHAEIMAKYAEVAARRHDPWVEFERYNYLTGGWDRLEEHPSWRPNAIYHYIGDKP